MHNMWDLILYGINISLVACLILLLKYIFRDLLSARWQYGIWSVLLIRMAIPFSSTRYIFIPAPTAVEALKMTAETGLSSAYTDTYSLINVSYPLPFISGKPVSITDWLFVVYIVGVIVCILGYFSSYIRLRLILRKGKPVPEEIKKEVKYIADIYSLRVPERIIYVKGLPSAFICGIINPVLALPAENETDGKIILHELIHLKYADTLQNGFWCLLRCLNWYNPLMQYTFGRINNDIEALCDRRVLEKLSGEERREYGNILLKMVNERYQRVPCTSSLSNGGTNIARRISSIVKFKKFPKGMGLVSVCIVIMLFIPCLHGSASDIGSYKPVISQSDFNFSVASARNARCTTVAGVIDTYAKAIIQKNGIMLLSALSEEKHGEIIAQMEKNINEPVYYYDTGIEIGTVDTYSFKTGYAVYNLLPISEKKYKAEIGFTIENNNEENENDIIYMLPVEVSYKNGWVITDTGEVYITESDFTDSLYTPSQCIYKLNGTNGKIKYSFQTVLWVNNESSDMTFTVGSNNGTDIYSAEPAVSAKFYRIHDNSSVHYEIYPEKKDVPYGKSLLLEKLSFITKEDYEEFEAGLKTAEQSLRNYINDSRAENSSRSIWRVDNTWDGTLTVADGGGFESSYMKIPKDLTKMPEVVKVWIFSGGEVIDEFTLFTKGE